MAYPPELPPATRTDATVAANTHAADHNKLAAALADFLEELGASPSGPYANLTERLEDLIDSAGLEATITPAAERIYYVSPRGDNDNDGRSWARPFATVKAALAVIGATPFCRIEVGTGTITETAAWGTIPPGTVITGAGKTATKILHGFNGDLVDLGQGAQLSNLTLDGQGATYTGRGITMTGTRGGQTLSDAQVINFEGPCIYFTNAAGSGFKLNDCLVYRYNAPSGSERYSIVSEDVQQLAAVPRKFDGLDSGGQATFDFAGANDTFVTSSFLNDLKFSPNSAGVLIVACRLASPRAVQELYGSNNVIMGCDVYSQIVIKAGQGGHSVGPNAYNTQPPKDESNLGSNKITHENYPFTPTFETAGTPTTVGNMGRSGFYTRAGNIITATLDINIGSTTVLGTGEIRIGLPAGRFSPDAIVAGTAIIFPAGGSTQYVAAVQIIGGVPYFRMVRDTSGIVTPTSPHGAGMGLNSNIRALITYRL